MQLNSLRTDKNNNDRIYRRKMIEFVDPFRVEVVDESIPALDEDEVLIKTNCSLISTGN